MSAELALFIPTFFLVSITPGMCMTLALSLGISVGFSRTLIMMIGELIGVAMVVVATALGVSAILLKTPSLFIALKSIGAAYLVYLGWQLFNARGNMAIRTDQPVQALGAKALLSQGFITAIANPKGWAFFVALLPPFIHTNEPLAPQLAQMLLIILLFEFICMCLYALGGQSLRLMLASESKVVLLNKLAGGLMMLVALWLIVS